MNVTPRGRSDWRAARNPSRFRNWLRMGACALVTNPRIFGPPSTMAQALRFLDALMACRGCSTIRPGPRHRAIFRALCEGRSVKGKRVADRGSRRFGDKKRMRMGYRRYRFCALRPATAVVTSVTFEKR